MFIPLFTILAKRRKDMNLIQAGNRLIAGLLFWVLCMMFTGCSLVPSNYLSRSPDKPTRAMVEGVPFFPQEEHQCGPAALAMALNWSGIAIEPADLTPEVYTPGLKGSLQNSLVGAARRHGRVAYPIAGIEALMVEVAAGQPVIVLVNLGFSWYPKWHYAVVIGYDQEKQEVMLHSGLTADEVLSFWTFNNIWKRSHHWGLLVLPPSRLPEAAEENEWLTAVGGLEKTGQWPAAATGYAAALKRWENSFTGWVGLGNSSYNLHQLDAAADAFRKAIQLQPENGIAYNNLANVLAEKGLLGEALQAAQRAVELGGPFQDIFLQTLADIKNMELKEE
jgi:tetratricopeptide (TPR) repeat protein